MRNDVNIKTEDLGFAENAASMDEIGVAINGGADSPPGGKKKHKMMRSRKNAHIFCICVLAFMLVQWCIFFVYANINSILLSFKYFDPKTQTQVFYPVNQMFTNFVSFLKDLFSSSAPLGKYFINGMIYHLSGLICLPISLIFAFIIYKKLPATGAMKIILFLPSIISGMVIALLFKVFMREGLLGFWANILDLPYSEFTSPLADEDKVFLTLILYQVFFGMPGSLLINIGTMSRTPVDLVEYGRLEGFSYFQEFRYLTLPLMFPVLQIYCLGMFVGFFTAQGPLYAIYGDGSSGTFLPENAISFGYYMMISAISSSMRGVDPQFSYGYTSAANLLIGLLSIPIVYGTKKLFDKFDPEAEF